MNYWLVKSEPSVYSWQQLVKDKKTVWEGVRNYAARNNMRAMEKGDLVFFYHSNEGLAIVGIAKVVREAYQDPSTTDIAWSVVDIAPVKALKQSVTLSQIKAEKDLSEMQIIRLSRLSVSAVSPKEFEKVLQLAQTKL
jgi:predicted RNA-binding protein with PUA-like domain